MLSVLNGAIILVRYHEETKCLVPGHAGPMTNEDSIASNVYFTPLSSVSINLLMTGIGHHSRDILYELFNFYFLGIEHQKVIPLAKNMNLPDLPPILKLKTSACPSRTPASTSAKKVGQESSNCQVFRQATTPHS